MMFVRKNLVLLLCLCLLSLACRFVPIPPALQTLPTATAQALPTEALPEQPEIQPEPTWTVMAPPTATESPVESTLPPEDLNTFDCEGVTFTFSPDVAAQAECSFIPAVPDEGAGWGGTPDTIRVDFSGYALSDTFHQPAVYVYPVTEYQEMSNPAVTVIDGLRNLIASQSASLPESLPLLPVWNAAQFFHAQEAYLEFQNGSGIRYLSMYGQAAFPVNNQMLFYTFQGLTNDGRYYISAILPIAHPALPPDGSVIPGDDYGAFSENFPQHLLDMTAMLNSQPDDSFQPTLTHLDQLVQSIQVNK